MSRQKREISTEIFSAAILSLRKRLGENGLGMARRLGLSPYVYQNLELGRTKLKAEELLRFLEICPDETTRRAFILKSGILNLGLPVLIETRDDPDASPTAEASPLTRQQREVACEEMRTGVGLICERAPGTVVHYLLDEIRRLAGTYGAPKLKRPSKV